MNEILVTFLYCTRASEKEIFMKKIAVVFMCIISLCLSGCGITSDDSNEKTFEAYYQSISDSDVVFEGNTNYVNSQILLTAADGVSKKQVEKLIKKQGGDIVGYISISNDYQIEFANNKTFEELNTIIADLKSNDDVENATLNYASQQNTSAIDYTKDPWIDANNAKDTSGSQWSEINPKGNNWWAEAIMLPSVWNMNVEFQPVKVGIFDTMFDTDNEDLQNKFVKIWNNPKNENGNCMVSSLYSSAKQANQSTTNYAHGTHVAGLIAAKAENHFGIAGVSQNVQLYGFSYVSALTDTENENIWNDFFEIKYSIALMLNEGVKVINFSVSESELLVAAQHGVENALTILDELSTSYERFFKKCLDAGYDFLIVKCAGNENHYNWKSCSANKDHPYGYMVDNTVEDNTVYDAQYDFFGAIKDETVKAHILIVGAVENHTDYYKTAEFSTVGKRVDVYAPGKSVLSDFPTNITVMDDGTSMSTPIVTGIAALVWGVNPDLSAEQVASIIRASTSITLFDSESVSNFFHTVDTTPIVNAYFAVQLAQNIPAEDNEEENTSGIVTGMAYHTSGENSVEAMTGVTITVFDAAESIIDTVNTSEFSGYSFVLPEGTYTVTAEADGYETESKEITLTKNEVLNVDFDMKEVVKELSEEELLSKVELEAGHEMESHVYVDLDHNETNELIGVYSDNNGSYQTWYCSSDGSTCKLVHQSEEWMDACDIDLLDVSNETHVAINVYRTMGTGGSYSILRLNNKEIECLISNKYGYVSMNNDGDILLDIEAYDSMYDPYSGGKLGHTWKDTYLFFDGSTYKEYGAKEISENEFLEYNNSQAIKNEIKNSLEKESTYLEFRYFKRKNGIMHIQCNVHKESGEIRYGYYTVRYSGNEIDENLGDYISGEMESSFSDLEVVY